MKETSIPRPIIAVVGEVLGNHYYSHTRLNTLFMESGAPGDPPQGNCVRKCQSWLLRCNSDPNVNAFGILGKILEEYMEYEINETRFGGDIRIENRARIEKALAKHGLSYHTGGQILGQGIGTPSKTLREILEKKDLTAVDMEFQRAIESVESDPAAAITAACSIVESLCKIYIEEEGLEIPTKQDIKSLWKVISKSLHLEPPKIEDEDITRILSGFVSVVDGIGALRTHTGSAHGRGRKLYRLEPRHARLAINGAHTLVCFIIETWEARKGKKS